jgi:hypothetical protein
MMSLRHKAKLHWKAQLLKGEGEREFIAGSDVEAEAPEAVAFWWNRKRQKR